MAAFPAWTSPRHPVVHGETRHWQRSRVWRATRVLLWAGSLLFLGVPVLCPLLVNLSQPAYASAAEAILINGLTVSFGLTIVAAVAGGLTSLLAGLLAATLISRERECQSWTFLRLTTLTSLEIVGGKLAALLRSLGRPMLFVLGLRLLAVAAVGLTAALAFAASGLTPPQLAQLWNAVAVELGITNWLLFQVSALVGVLVGLLAWLIEPFFSVLYTAAVGLAASSLARSRGAAIVLSIGLHFALGLALYAPAQQVTSVGLFVALPGSAPGPQPAVLGALPLLFIVLTAYLQVALQGGIIVLCLLFALHRVQHLSE